MSNRYQPHLVIVPEDDATRQFANGLVRPMAEKYYNYDIVHEQKGWSEAVAKIDSLNLKKFPKRRVLLVIDLDKNGDKRISSVRDDLEKKYGSEILKRIFIVGSFMEVEDLKDAFKERNLETVGAMLGGNCDLWNNELLKDCRNEACKLKKDIEENFSQNPL